MTRLHKRLAGAALAMLTATAAIADYPERPIKMVIPYGAGGATDISARSIAGPLGDAVGKPIVMANVTGAGGRQVLSRFRTPRVTAILCCLRVWVLTPLTRR